MHLSTHNWMRAEPLATTLRRIKKYGYEQMERCVTRYAAKVKADGTQTKFIKQGSTFFNGGFEDYLDENYSQEGGVTGGTAGELPEGSYGFDYGPDN